MTGEPRERRARVTPASSGRLKVLRAALDLLREYGSDDDLFPKLCEFLCNERGYLLVWIGRALDDGKVEVVARGGPAVAYADGLDVRWDGGPFAVGPSGRAISTQQPVVIDVDDDYFGAWQERAKPYGFRHTAALPFEFMDHSLGVMCLYAEVDLRREMQLLDNLAKVVSLRGALSLKESEAQRRFKRLESLWTLSFLPEIDDTQRFEAILREGARALGSDRDFWGVLSHIEGDKVIFDSLSPHEHPTLIDGEWTTVKSGDSIPLAIALQSIFLQNQKTAAWSDLHLAPPSTAIDRIINMGWHSVIGTPFAVAGTQYVVLFHSRARATRPFDAEDLAYVELIATFFARALREIAQESAIRYQAEHDALTGLINRAAFREYFERALERARRISGRCAVIMMDLDHFKEVNDTLGHNAGDVVLREASERLRNALRGEEIISRLGGDEFSVVIRDAPTEAVIEAIAERISRSFARPFQVEMDELRITSSLGIAQFPDDGETVDLLLAHADAAMYQAKNAGRNRHQFFNESIQAQLIERRQLQEAIMRAVENDEFVLHYHPEVDLRTGEILRCEALIRWPRRKGEAIIPPSVLIAFAQDTGLMRAISTWVVRRAINDYALLARKDRRFRVFVNLSSMEVSDPEFIAELRRQYSAARPRGLLLGVEVTEAAALREPEKARETLTTLRDDGFEIALDDFGTGYSSLSMLKTLPIDILKIDRSFINGITTDRNDAAIVRTIISFAQLLGRRTVAEGVETNEQAELLRVYGCHYAQGFLVSRPMPVDEFKRWSDQRDSNRERGQVVLDAEGT
jgi:diguanylate cyclase (GGDEF)-like protein